MNKTVPDTIINTIKKFQKGEITEYHIYKKIAKREKNPENKK